MEKDFGKIVKVNIREYFKNEAIDFTPWLSEHIQDISNLLGIEITDAQTEKDVGDFSLDIIAKETRTNSIVAIENQLEETDHRHLGQIITYTAGLNAGIVIWVSPEIRPEHEDALEWLNEKTDCKFFGIEISFLKIGESKPAPYYTVKVKPTTWNDSIKTTKAEFTPRNQIYQEFFEGLLKRYCEKYPARKKIKALAQSWNGFGAGKSGLGFNWVFTGSKHFGVELYISTSDKIKNKEYFETLKKESSDLEIKDVSWEKLDDKLASRVGVYTHGEIDTAHIDVKERERLIAWGIEMMNTFITHFGPIIKRLQ